MSLINRMLQDLEQRRTPGDERIQLTGVRAIAPRGITRRSGWWLGTLVALLGVIAALVWLLQRQTPAPVSPPAAPVATQPPMAPVAAQPPAAPVAAQPPAAPAVAKPPVVDKPPVVPAAIKPPAAPVAAPPPPKADIPVVPKPAVAKKAESPPVNPNSNPEKSPKVVPPVIPSAANIKGVEEARAAPGKNESTGKKPEAAGVAPAKQISPRQQAEFLYQKAVALLQQGLVTEAQESLGASLKIEPDYAASRQALAGILVEKKEYVQAERLLSEGLSREGHHPEFAMVMARIQVERGDGAGALETLKNNLAGGKDQAGYQAFLAALQQRQGQHKLAIESYLTALRLAPNTASSLVGLGISLQAENHPAEAQEAFNRAKTAGGLSPDLQSFVEQRLKQIQQQQK